MIVGKVPLGYHQYTSTATAFDLTGGGTFAIPTGTVAVLLQAEAQSIRWRADGTAPTATVGMLLLTTTDPVLYFGQAKRLQFIAAAVGAILNATFFK